MSGTTKNIFRTFGVFLGMLCPMLVWAEYLDLPPTGSDLIGHLRYVKARQSDTLIDVAHDFSVGQDEIVMANPTVSRWLPGEGTKVLIPARFILPDAERTGIVVNIPEMRLYFFPPGDGKNPPTQVITYPISIGRMDWKSPMGITKIVEKIKDPSWTPPESIKKEHAAEGDILPDVVPPGPNNPLGRFAMRLGVKGSYLIHGTGEDKADGIGMMVTHGCMRMYPEDIEQLYPKVAKGTQVNLVNQPVKVGWNGDMLYVEVSQPLDEDHLKYDQLLKLAMAQIQKKTAGRADFALNGEALRAALEKPNGIPVAISGGPVGSILTARSERIPLVSRNARTSSAAPAPAAAPGLPAPTAVPGLAAPSMAPASPATLGGSGYAAPAERSPTAQQPQVPTQRPYHIPPTPASPPLQANSNAGQPTQTYPGQPLVQPAKAVRPPPAPAIAPASPSPAARPSSSKPEEQLLPPIY